MPQHSPALGYFTSVTGSPEGEINVESMERECTQDYNSNLTISSQLAKLFTHGTGPGARGGACSEDSEGELLSSQGSQGSMTSSVLRLLNISSQTASNDGDEDGISDSELDIGYHSDLSNLVCKVRQNIKSSSSLLLNNNNNNNTKHDSTDNEVQSPRCETPTDSIVQFDESLQNQNSTAHQMEVTPVKTENPELDPLTPMCNLKMLISVASKEIRAREEQLEEVNQVKSDEVQTKVEEVMEGDEAEKTKTELDVTVSTVTSRKEKSLGLLCQRFLHRYPEHPGPLEREEISLDEVAKDLAVERRRIYDIVNVLESVEMVSRVAKNRYKWHGKTSLHATLVNLKLLAEQEGLAEKIEQISRFDLIRGLGDLRAVPTSPRKKMAAETLNDVSNVDRGVLFKDYLQKDKSLGIMSQKFLMLFLVCKNKLISLDLAAKVLIGDPSIDLTENAKFKTKIRRLYDIANILTSLNLIRKVHLDEVKGRKPAFKYSGPNISKKNLVHDNESERPTSRHSLLDVVRKPLFAADSSSTSNSSSTDAMSERPQVKEPFRRHLSLDQICEVAERERNRLYFESNSQPSSPEKKQQPKSKRALLPKTKSMPPAPCSTSDPSSPTTLSPIPDSVKHFVMIRSTPKPGKTGNSSKKGITIQKVPINNKSDTRVKVTASQDQNQTPQFRVLQSNVKVSKGQGNVEKNVVFKTQIVQQRTNGEGGSGGATRVVKVSKNQLDSVLKSYMQNKGRKMVVSPGACTMPKIHVVRMHPPGPVVNNSAPSSSLSANQLQAASGGMSTPIADVAVDAKLGKVASRKRQVPDSLPDQGAQCYFDSKRPRLSAESEVTESDAHQASQEGGAKQLSPVPQPRPSPRVLHLDHPEFQVSPSSTLQLSAEKTPSPELLIPVNSDGQHTSEFSVLASPLPGDSLNLTNSQSTSHEQSARAENQTTPQPLTNVPTADTTIIKGAFTTVHTLPQHQSSSPIMMVSTPVSGIDSLQTLIHQHGTTFSTGAKSAGASRTASVLHPHNHHVVSPVPLHISPVTSTSMPINGSVGQLSSHIVALNAARGIPRASSAIINLIPHLTRDSNSKEPQQQQAPRRLITTVPYHHQCLQPHSKTFGEEVRHITPTQSRPSLIQQNGLNHSVETQKIQRQGFSVTLTPNETTGRAASAEVLTTSTGIPIIPTGIPLTPISGLPVTPNSIQIHAPSGNPMKNPLPRSGIPITPNSVPVTPTSLTNISGIQHHTADTSLPMTPSTFYRSTPGGVYQMATVVPQVMLGQSLSAFQPLGTNNINNNPTAQHGKTARRLSLIQSEADL